MTDPFGASAVATRIAGWVLGGLVLGAAVGGTLAATGVIGSDDTRLTLPADGVPFSRCFSGTAIGEFHVGDRVYATGRNADSSWVEVRAPFDLNERVWMQTGDLTPDDDIQALPVTDCEVPLAAPPTSVSTVPVEESTTTSTAASSTTTTVSGGSSSTTATTPTTAPDTTAPVIGTSSALPDPIWELDTQSVSCGAEPRQATVTVQVTDNRGVASVGLSWQFASGATGSAAMTASGNSWSATFGPFPYLTIAEDPGFEFVALVITARDGAGNTAADAEDITVISTSQCFG